MKTRNEIETKLRMKLFRKRSVHSLIISCLFVSVCTKLLSMIMIPKMLSEQISVNCHYPLDSQIHLLLCEFAIILGWILTMIVFYRKHWHWDTFSSVILIILGGSVVYFIYESAYIIACGKVVNLFNTWGNF